MGDLWRAAADLVLGVGCPLCGRPGSGVCRRCATPLAPRPTPVDLAGLDVVAAGVHDGARREALLAWKVGGDAGLDPLMAHHLAAAVVELVGDLPEVVLVPVPSTRRSRRERGRDLVGDLAARCALDLSGAGLDARVEPVLRLTRQTRDQHALDRRSRAVNLAGSMCAVRAPRRGPVVVVDDVVTTGSTMLEAARALSVDPSCHVVGGAALAVASHPVSGLRSR